MRILVAGATGTLGTMVALQLRQQGHAVRALVRPRTDGSALEESGIEIVAGDLKEPASLGPACAGVDAVVTTANSARRGGDDNVETIEIAGNRALIDAARAAGVGRFVFVSALGAAPDSPVPFLRGKGLAEEHLKASGLPYAIVKPDFFMDVWIGMIVLAPLAAGKPVTLVGEGRRQHSMVSMGDVAAFATAAVTHPAALGRTTVVGGPEPVSWRDIVAAAERITGRSSTNSCRYCGSSGTLRSRRSPSAAANVACTTSSSATVDRMIAARLPAVPRDVRSRCGRRLLGVPSRCALRYSPWGRPCGLMAPASAAS